MPTDKNDVAEASANPGYALGQLAKAFTTSQTHEDADTRQRASTKIQKWLDVFTGMLSGLLNVGSRTPVANVPAWATLEVAQGGFSTGRLLAEGELQPHEKELLATLAPAGAGPPRAVFNTHYLSDVGLAQLQEMLASGCYRLDLPEEGALLTIAWLLKHGQADDARRVLDALGPFLSRLRFYPIPTSRPITTDENVYLQTIATTVQQLRGLRMSVEIQKQREAVLVWAPLSDRVVDLFLGTFTGKFLDAARRAGALLEGSLYERYYAIPYARVRKLDDVKTSRFGASTSQGFDELCCQLAQSSRGTRSVAGNGMVIEQQQILTTHNLAVLFGALGLAQALDLEYLARRCLQWLCRRLQHMPTDWKTQLQTVKNAAYAWRQMVFFLSLQPADGVDRFLTSAHEYLATQDAAFRTRFQPALNGLRVVFEGGALLPGQGENAGSRRFLGWTTDKHWLLA